MIVTIDGPAGAGKSTIARQLADRLGIEYLDTGAMYRAVTWAALQQGIDPADESALVQLISHLRYDVDQDRIRVDGVDVTQEIRDPAVARAVSQVAAHPAVREHLVRWQRELARGRSIVTEGRDQGTVVFPDADVKIFLTASAEERARRRVAQWKEQGIQADYQEVLREQQRRDALDSSRPVGALKRANDAIEVDTDGRTVAEVVESIVELVRRAGDR